MSDTPPNPKPSVSGEPGLLAFASLCWGVCWALYFSQFFGTDEVLSSPFSLFITLCIPQIFPFAAAVGSIISPASSKKNDPKGNDNAWCIDFLKALLFVILLVHLFVNVGSLLVGKHTVLAAYFMIVVNFIGYLLIALVKETESCYGFLVCFLAGVSWNSYKGFHPHGDGDSARFKVFVCLLSVAVVFLCGVYSRPNGTLDNATEESMTNDVENLSHEGKPDDLGGVANGGSQEETTSLSVV